ncbi:MAG: PhoPQ-activated pathogenicity-related family protein, partial [Deltaproteobacteria bacterium]|nr:PhoPQ-activated pathogenicity-related family protein [Deltaproteobacteria bacterium]
MDSCKLQYARMLCLGAVVGMAACSADEELGPDGDCIGCQDADEFRAGPIDEGPLFDYVSAPDAAYSFAPAGQIPGEGFTAYLLQMTSQQWRTPDEVTPNLWNHWVTVVVPDQLLTTQAHLIITGGSMSADPPDGDDLALFGPIALGTGAPVVILSEVPGQPLAFPDRPETLREDELVAYSWKKAMETGDPTWAAYLPMTKAAVRAMDTAEAFLAATLGAAPTGFIVTGFSKRGATAWLTAAVDPRVTADVPGVFNVLNLAQQVDNQFEN